MSKHTITTEVKVEFRISGMPEDEHETACPTIEIDYSYAPGRLECRYQNNGDPGYPAEAAEVGLISAKLIDGDGLSPTQELINDWAESWLDDEGYDHAIANAELDREPDPDVAYEKMRDEPSEVDRGEGDDY